MAKYFRLTNHLVSGGVDQFDNPVGPPSVQIYVSTYEVLRSTPKGVWLSYCGGERFVRNDARKKFACPTVEEAKESFLARKKRQIKILKSQLSHAQQAYVMAERACKIFSEKCGVSGEFER